MTHSLRERLKHLQQQLPHHQLQALLVSSPFNITYLTGIHPISHFHREVFLILTRTASKLLVSPLCLSRFSHLTHPKPIAFGKDQPLSHFINALTKKKQTLGIEANDLRVSELTQLQTKLHATIKPTTDIIAGLRLIKDKQEINHITAACQMTSQAWHWLQPQIQPGVTERQLARLLHSHLLELGADGFPVGFEPIIAFGPHTAIPHHTTSNRTLQLNEPVLVDFGCTVQGYASDFTRTIFIGQPTSEFRQIEAVVQQAYQLALTSLSTTDSPQQIDHLVRQHITTAGFGDQFIHNTGHGLGLEIHEAPHFHHQYREPNLLKPGMVIAIEPGIYLSGKFGYRHENTILITPEQGNTIQLTNP